MPPPGVAPKGVPQIGTPGGGAHPSTDPYTAAMALYNYGWPGKLTFWL